MQYDQYIEPSLGHLNTNSSTWILCRSKLAAAETTVVKSYNILFNTLRPRQNDRQFPDNIFKCIFLNGNVCILIKISLKFVSKVPIDNISALVQIIGWHQRGNKLLSEPKVVSLLMHICTTWPQLVDITVSLAGGGSYESSAEVPKIPFHNFSIRDIHDFVWKCLFYSQNHIHVRWVSPQLSCSNTCQVWISYSIGNWCFGHSEKKWEKITDR